MQNFMKINLISHKTYFLESLSMNWISIIKVIFLTSCHFVFAATISYLVVLPSAADNILRISTET